MIVVTRATGNLGRLVIAEVPGQEFQDGVPGQEFQRSSREFQDRRGVPGQTGEFQDTKLPLRQEFQEFQDKSSRTEFQDESSRTRVPESSRSSGVPGQTKLPLRQESQEESVASLPKQRTYL
jgi:hypothetical protein